ncbi:MAG: hypothetical protein JST57_09975 [Bacteroidetes bacterium]|nr:hypothetical protein [Bacteroidota bacterium]HMU25240.1 hypothetical protein [Ferruginibacter sp.]
MENTQSTGIINPTAKARKLANYGLLAGLFAYPQNESYKNSVTQTYEYLENGFPEAAITLQPFVEFVSSASIKDIQELYLRTFDVQSITTLDIGFVLFGEDYKRGKLLVHLNEEHKKAGNLCETELADHLPNLLRLLPKIQEDEIQTEIAELLLLPAVEKMVSEFLPGKLEKKDSVYKKHQKVFLDYSQNYRTIFQYSLMALFMVMQRDFDYNQQPAQPDTRDPGNPASGNHPTEVKDFSQNIETEMLTEK